MRIISRDSGVALAFGVALLTATSVGATELKGGEEGAVLGVAYELSAAQMDMISAGQVDPLRIASETLYGGLLAAAGTQAGLVTGGPANAIALGLVGLAEGRIIGAYVAEILETQGPAALQLLLYGVPNYNVSILPDTNPSTTQNTSTTTTQNTSTTTTQNTSTTQNTTPDSTSPSTTTSPTFYILGGQVTAR